MYLDVLHFENLIFIDSYLNCFVYASESELVLYRVQSELRACLNRVRIYGVSLYVTAVCVEVVPEVITSQEQNVIFIKLKEKNLIRCICDK